MDPRRYLNLAVTQSLDFDSLAETLEKSLLRKRLADYQTLVKDLDVDVLIYKVDSAKGEFWVHFAAVEAACDLLNLPCLKIPQPRFRPQTPLQEKLYTAWRESRNKLRSLNAKAVQIDPFNCSTIDGEFQLILDILAEEENCVMIRLVLKIVAVEESTRN